MIPGIDPGIDIDPGIGRSAVGPIGTERRVNALTVLSRFDTAERKAFSINVRTYTALTL